MIFQSVIYYVGVRICQSWKIGPIPKKHVADLVSKKYSEIEFKPWKRGLKFQGSFVRIQGLHGSEKSFFCVCRVRGSNYYLRHIRLQCHPFHRPSACLTNEPGPFSS